MAENQRLLRKVIILDGCYSRETMAHVQTTLWFEWANRKVVNAKFRKTHSTEQFYWKENLKRKSLNSLPIICVGILWHCYWDEDAGKSSPNELCIFFWPILLLQNVQIYTAHLGQASFQRRDNVYRYPILKAQRRGSSPVRVNEDETKHENETQKRKRNKTKRNETQNESWLRYWRSDGCEVLILHWLADGVESVGVSKDLE